MSELLLKGLTGWCNLSALFCGISHLTQKSRTDYVLQTPDTLLKN
jgi:hypothetical protein